MLIISIVLSIGLFVGLGFKENVTKNEYGRIINREILFNLNKKQIFSVLPLLLILFNLFTVIPVNNVGILYSPINGIKEETMGEGFKSKGILDKIYKISTEVQSVQLKNITGQTKDSQWVNLTIDIKYKVNESTAFNVFKQYRNLNNVNTNFIPPTVQRSVESVTTNFNVMDILGEKRNEVYKGIEIELKEKFLQSGIEFVSINLIDSDAGEGIEKAIQDQAIAKQAVETAEQQRKKSEIESQQIIITAKAEKEAALIKAEIRKIEAEAEAEVNRKMAESITPLVIQRMEMQARLKHGWVTIQGVNTVVGK